MARIRTKPTVRARRAFLKLEEIRHSLSGALTHDIDEVFDRNIAQMKDVAEEYAYRCEDLDYAAQSEMLPPKLMAGVRKHFEKWQRIAETSPLGWMTAVEKRLDLAVNGGFLPRIELLILELDCITMAMFDEIFMIEDQSHSAIIKQSRDQTLYSIFKLYKRSPGTEYVPLTEAFVDAIKYNLPKDLPGYKNYGIPDWFYNKSWSQSDKGTFLDKIPAIRNDTDFGIRSRARTSATRGDTEGMPAEIEKWMEKKRHQMKASAKTDSVENATKGEMVGLSEADVEWVMIDNPMDERTSEICQAMYGTVLKVEDCVPWDTAPPFHYYCRSTLIPVSDPEDLGEWVEFKKNLADWMANEGD